MAKGRLDLPTNEENFSAFMEAIDQRLIAKDIPASWRQVAAIAEICWEADDQRPVPKDRQPITGCYDGDDLLLRAIHWYEERYGDALQTYWGPGRSVFFLRGDLWGIRYPLIAGEAVFVTGEHAEDVSVALIAGKGYMPVLPGHGQDVNHLRRVNIFDHVENFPQSLVDTLRPHELVQVLHHFCSFRTHLNGLLMTRRFRFVESARGDLAAAVEHLLSQPPRCGLSRWASHQASEKLLKSFIHHAGTTFKKTHDLCRLEETAVSLGMQPMPNGMIDEIACSPNERYDDSIDRQLAHRALVQSLQLCGQVARELKTTFQSPGDSDTTI